MKRRKEKIVKLSIKIGDDAKEVDHLLTEIEKISKIQWNTVSDIFKGKCIVETGLILFNLKTSELRKHFHIEIRIYEDGYCSLWEGTNGDPSPESGIIVLTDSDFLLNPKKWLTFDETLAVLT